MNVSITSAPQDLQRRIFIVGCGRSGTTLLQCLVAAHSKIISFPESKMLQYLVPHHEPRRLALGLSARQFQPQVTAFFNEIGYPDLAQGWSTWPLPIAWQFKRFIKALDEIAQRNQKTIWLEKSPRHLHYLDYIERYVPRFKIIHLVRNGADVIASLYDAARKHPKKWGRDHDTVEKCLHRWRTDVAITRQALGRPNHILVRYEDLVADPEAQMHQLCTFLEISFEAAMLEDYRVAAQPLTQNRYEHCEPAVTEKIQNANSTKFYTLFTPEEQHYITDQLQDIDLEQLSA
ncbi:MAG: sulfotransferase [Spirulina sp. SIO3F2]|nr:sulfotransferase [Spirulina sp. SIO3F2]